MGDIIEKDNSGNVDCVIPALNILNNSEIELINQNSNIVRHNKKDVIFRQNTRTSHIMYLKSGLIKIFKEGRNNKIIILKISKPDNFIGLMSVFGEDIHQYSASAIEPSEIYYTDITIFRNIIQQNGSYALKLVNLLSLDGLFIFNRLMSQSHKQLPGRIADVILYFSETIYNNHIFNFPLTRRELAELAGTTKESFIRTLTEFKNDRIIELNGSNVEIKSMKIIKTLSELG